MSYGRIETHYSSPSSQILTNKFNAYSVKCHFPQNLHYFNRLISNKSESYSVPGKSCPFDTRRLVRKYYSKKILRGAFVDQKNVPKSAERHCKRLQRLWLQNSGTIKCHLPCLRQLSIVTLPGQGKRADMEHLIRPLKQLRVLDLQLDKNTFSLRILRYLARVTSLKMELFASEVLEALPVIFRLSRLTKIHLKIKVCDFLNAENNKRKFLENLTNILLSGRLRYLRLNFSDQWLDAQFLEDLFTCLNYSSFLSWHIQANTDSHRIFTSDYQSTLSFFSKLDFLLLATKGSIRTNYMKFTLKQPHIEEDYFPLPKKRRLDIFLFSDTHVNLLTLLSKFPSLVGLYISGYLEIPRLEFPINTPNCLKSIKYIRLVEVNFTEANERQEKTFLDLFQHCPSLEEVSLQTNNDIVCNLQDLGDLRLQKVNLSLPLSFQKHATLVQPILQNIENLRKLSISYSRNEKPPFVGFEGLYQLQELQIDFLIYSMAPSFVAECIDKMAELENLETLHFGYQFVKIDLHIYSKIFSNLVEHKNLKKLSILTNQGGGGGSAIEIAKAIKEVEEFVKENEKIRFVRLFNQTWLDILNIRY